MIDQNSLIEQKYPTRSQHDNHILKASVIVWCSVSKMFHPVSLKSRGRQNYLLLRLLLNSLEIVVNVCKQSKIAIKLLHETAQEKYWKLKEWEFNKVANQKS